MLVNKHVRPERKVYYISALVLDVLKGYSGKSLDYFDVFKELNRQEKVSIALFSLALDWLFILGAIRSNKGSVEKCF